MVSNPLSYGIWRGLFLPVTLFYKNIIMIKKKYEKNKIIIPWSLLSQASYKFSLNNLTIEGIFRCSNGKFEHGVSEFKIILPKQAVKL